MSEILQNGFRVKTLLGGTAKVEKYLAEGGQGAVYVVEYNGEKKLSNGTKKQAWEQIRKHFTITLNRML